MSREDMFGGFDPYDMLITLNERLLMLEQTHNALARQYERTTRDYHEFLVRYKALEESHLALSNAYMQSEMQRLLKNP